MKRVMPLIATLILLSPCIHANSLDKLLSKSSVSINECTYQYTGNVLDVALTNKGYLVLQHGKRSIAYTRTGGLSLNNEGYVVSKKTGGYVLGLDQSASNELVRIQIPTESLAPRATSTIKMGLNLSASSKINEEFTSALEIYDSLGAAHILSMRINKEKVSIWQVVINIDEQYVTKGRLVFGSDGKLSDQPGLHEFQWAGASSTQILEMNFERATQYDAPSSVNAIIQNGHSSGNVSHLEITSDGEFKLRYDNGQIKILDTMLAVALFNHPEQLRVLPDNVYLSTEASGSANLEPENGEGAFLSGYLQKEECLPKA